MHDEKCCFHPQHMIIGVCAFCLNERLLILATSKQEDHHRQSAAGNTFKFFAITSLLNRFDNLRHNNKFPQHQYYDDSAASASPEDSFISIKFEGSGGVGSWEKKCTTKPKVSIDMNNYISSSFNQEVETTNTTAAVIEHSKTPRGGPLRWRKRIGQLFQIIRWKRPIVVKAHHHVPSNLEASVKVRHGWITSLTKKRTTYTKD